MINLGNLSKQGKKRKEFRKIGFKSVLLMAKFLILCTLKEITTTEVK